ncbi:hypothetical protein MMC27_001357 [Xylographa pallens]|nr:hypothetical protein [Xylographa pallens]
MLYLPPTASTLLLLLYSALTTAQSTSSQIPSTLPACAQTCIALTQASQSCASNQATYQSCFCQSALLSSLKTSPTDNKCSPQCGDADFATIASWYNGQCGTSAAGAPATTPSTLLTSTTSNAGSAPTGAAATTDAPSSATSAPELPPNDAPINGPAWYAPQISLNEACYTSSTYMPSSPLYQSDSWFSSRFSTHYQWVIMLIVLAIGLILLAVLLTWLRKRHARRREASENAGPHPAMEEWAPNQRNVHDVGNFGAAQAVNTRSDTARGKEREPAAAGQRTGSRRLKKTLFSGSKS